MHYYATVCLCTDLLADILNDLAGRGAQFGLLLDQVRTTWMSPKQLNVETKGV